MLDELKQKKVLNENNNKKSNYKRDKMNKTDGISLSRDPGKSFISWSMNSMSEICKSLLSVLVS